MDIFETRRRNFRLLIDLRYKGVVAQAADSFDKPASQLHRWLTDRADARQRMHESSARAIEEMAGIESGWLDRTHSGETAPPISTSLPKGTIPVSIDKAVGLLDNLLDSLGADWETLGVSRELALARLRAKMEGRSLPKSLPGGAKRNKARQ